MPKYVMDACRHTRTSGWGVGGRLFTCLSCFQRLQYVDYEYNGVSGKGRLVAEPAPGWDGQCLHIASFLQPLEMKKGRPDRAFCKNCGCIVEHPPGPGKWTPVLFYGYIIREEPALSL